MKNLTFGISFLVVTTCYFLIRWLVTSSYSVQLVSEWYECEASICNYSYELRNTSNNYESGEVIVKTYKDGGIKTNVDLSFISEPYNVSPMGKVKIAGEISNSEPVAYLKFIHVSK